MYNIMYRLNFADLFAILRVICVYLQLAIYCRYSRGCYKYHYTTSFFNNLPNMILYIISFGYQENVEIIMYTARLL